MTPQIQYIHTSVTNRLTEASSDNSLGSPKYHIRFIKRITQTYVDLTLVYACVCYETVAIIFLVYVGILIMPD